MKKPSDGAAGRARILLVDDDEMLVRSFEAALEELGYSVVSTTDPGAALELLRADPAAFDLLFTDLIMPKMTGLRLAQEATRIMPDLPVIICTGFNDAIDAEVARLSGAPLFLKKPLGLREMAGALQALLGEKAQAGS